MSVTGMMYKLIIGPLELLFDAVYAVANRYLSPGLSLIALSLAINFLVLPLYNRADAIQAEEREQGRKLKAGVDHIKATFKGDERFMMLQTYYRQNGYKPYYVLKGTLSLLLEIPFFIAAYRYLSGLQMLQGVAFGPIPDLGKPDGLVQIGGYSLNLLPILMTGINIVSGAIYTKGQPLKDKIQLYGMAVLFLVLLFNSPSGLVFYWTLNNVFSLVKNIFVKLREPKKVLGWISACCGAGAIGLIGVRPPAGMRAKLILGLIGAALMAPAVMQQIRRKHPPRIHWEETKQDRVIFIGSCVLLAVLTGLLIPSAVIRSSPAEFIDMRQIQSPLRYLVSSGLLAGGAFLVWSGIFYGISPSGTRKSMSLMFLLAAGIGVTDYMFFGKNYGNMSPQMKYDVGLRITYTQYLVNSLAVALVVLLVIWIWRKKKALIQAVCFAGCIAVLIMSLFNIGSINKSTARIMEQRAADVTYTGSIPLDRNGKKRDGDHAGPRHQRVCPVYSGRAARTERAV